jgi:hypothetical protein
MEEPFFIATEYPSMDPENTHQFYILSSGDAYIARDVWVDDEEDLEKLKHWDALVREKKVLPLRNNPNLMLDLLEEVKYAEWRSEPQIEKEVGVFSVCDGHSQSLYWIADGKFHKRNYHGTLYTYPEPFEATAVNLILEYLKYGMRKEGLGGGFFAVRFLG